MVASVQAAGAYIADQLEDGQERDRKSIPGEKGALTRPESTVKKANADRKQFRQNLRVSRRCAMIMFRLVADNSDVFCDYRNSLKCLPGFVTRKSHSSVTLAVDTSLNESGISATSDRRTGQHTPCLASR